MIAHELIKKFTKNELITVLVSSLIVGLIFYLLNLSSALWLYLIVIFIFVLIQQLLVHLINKPGTTIIYFLLVALISYSVSLFGLIGITKIISFLLAALIFELIFLVLKLSIHNIPLDLALGIIVSIALIPLISALFLSRQVVSSFPLLLLNSVLLYASVALLSSIISLIIWKAIKFSKIILKLSADSGTINQ